MLIGRLAPGGKVLAAGRYDALQRRKTEGGRPVKPEVRGLSAGKCAPRVFAFGKPKLQKSIL